MFFVLKSRVKFIALTRYTFIATNQTFSKINNCIKKTKINNLRSTQLIIKIKIIFLYWIIIRLTCMIVKLHISWYINKFFLLKILINLFLKFEINIVSAIFCNILIVVRYIRILIVIAIFWIIFRIKQLKKKKKIKQISLFW